MRVIFGVRFNKDIFIMNSSLCYICIELLVVILFYCNFKCIFKKGERERVNF